VVSVALPIPPRRNFSYRVPDGAPVPAAGARVRVPFGERVLTGVVAAAESGEPPESLREIIAVLDEEPVCPPELLATAGRVAERFFASLGEVLRAALPARLPAAGAVRYRITGRGAVGASLAPPPEREILDALAGGESVSVGDLPGAGASRREVLRSLEDRGWIRPVSSRRDRDRAMERAYLPARLDESRREAALGRSRRGREVLGFLERLGRPATAQEIRMETGAGAGVLRVLAERGLLQTFEQARRREEPEPVRMAVPERFVLTPEQRDAVDRMAAAIRERRFLPALLQGVTGSGKTEVYLRCIAAALDAGRGAVWLVPEIALTPVFARELRRQFGGRAAVLHSALSERERAEAWDGIRAGTYRAVIGPRSASFAPVADPGLFVVDEEHDASYKQRESPRYDAREVVSIRARQAGAALLFGSATPSLEAIEAAHSGRIDGLRLSERVEKRSLPDVRIVDLRREIPRPSEKGIPLFSGALLDRLEEVFARGEQAILLQPRRGYAPFLLCRECGHDFRCSRCSVARTVHGRGRTLVCHYCGERVARPERCPECSGALLEAIGAGTERVAERFAEQFPGVAYAVLDRDSARRGGFGAIVDGMLSGAITCLIGTQMVAKGHDFPGVTAVGVLSADTLLNFPDFRAAERTFQLVSQVSGRAGRGDRPGTVHVQTFHPDHPAIRRAASHDLDGFAAVELEFRRTFFYPPFADLASILVSSPARDRAQEAADDLGRAARASSQNLRISGPAPAPLERLQGRWRFQLLIRAASRKSVLEALEAIVPERPPAGVSIAVDVDPQDLM
jgi:primosomal protein N' (replication factor Y)